jgi:two-component system cell cycle sensor histidine kinase/response regulator CckA
MGVVAQPPRGRSDDATGLPTPGASTLRGLPAIELLTALQRGSPFIRIRSSSGPPEQPKAREPTPVPGGETILLVEDDAQVRSVARGILQRYGYVVLEASSAGEAILFCNEHGGGIDLLLSDIVMPVMSGPVLAKRLVALRPAMKVLFMSGYTDDAAVRHGVIDAAFAYLQKPLTVEALTNKVRSVLESALRG